MIGLVWCAKAGKLVCIFVPIEVAAIDYYAAHLSGVAVHVLRRGMRYDVATPFEGTAVDRCGEGVIHDERHTMFVSHFGEAFDVEDVAAGIGDGFTEEALCVRTESCFDALVVPIGMREGALDAQLLECHAEEVERAAINGVGCYEVVASLTDIEDGIEVCSLSAARQHSSDTTFQGSNLLCNSVVRGICKTSIEVSGVLEVEQTSHLVACLIAESCALINGKLLRFAFLGLPSAVDADGFEVFLHRCEKS